MRVIARTLRRIAAKGRKRSIGGDPAEAAFVKGFGLSGFVECQEKIVRRQGGEY